MNIVLLAPAGLALLATLIVPILLHLARRRRAQPTTFAALRWLAPGAPPRSRVQLEDLFLLLLRLLLIALLALWLAQPVWRDAPALRGARIAVVPGVDVAAARNAIGEGAASAHWLAPGWPAFDPQVVPPRGQPVASLLRDLDAALASDASLMVVVPAELDGLDAERVRLSRDVAWRIVPSTPVATDTAKPAPILLALRFGPEAAPMQRYVEAAVAAWNTSEPGRYRLDAQPWGTPLAPGTTWLIGLDGAPDAAMTRWIEGGGAALLDADPRDAPAKDTAARTHESTAPLRVRRRAFGSGELVLPSAPLRVGHAELLEPTFPARLQRWLAGAEPAPRLALAASVAPLRGDVALSPPERPLAPWLALAVAMLFVLERWFANGPRLGRAR